MERTDNPARSGETAFYAFTLALATGPLDRVIYENQLPAAVRAAAWAAIYLGFALLLLRHPRATLAAYGRVWPLLLMPAYALLSVAWSVRPLHTAISSLELTAAVVFGAALGSRLDERRLLTVAVAVLGGLAAADLAFTVLSPEGLDPNGEAVGIFSHKNANGGVMATAVLACAALLIYGGRRLLALATAVLALPMLALSGSRTSWVAAAAGLVAIEMLRLGRLGRPARMVAGLLGLGSVCTLAVLWMGSGLDLFAMFFQATDKDPTLTGRTDLWELAWNYIDTAPFFGHGYDAFWTSDPISDAAYVNEAMRENLKSFHNGLLEAAVDLGWVGTLLQLALIAAFLLPLRRLVRHGDRAAAAFAAALLVQIAVTNVSEVALFLRHGFNLLLLSALWSRSGMKKPPAAPGYGMARGGKAKGRVVGEEWEKIPPLPALPKVDQGQAQ